MRENLTTKDKYLKTTKKLIFLLLLEGYELLYYMHDVMDEVQLINIENEGEDK